MQAKGFVAALFDYSFTAFVTPRIIKVLYVLATIVVSLWTLFLVLAAFNVSSGFGLLMLVVGGPLFFLISMIYARVLLELIIVFFRINGNVQEIRDGRAGSAEQPTPTPEMPPSVTADPVPAGSAAEEVDQPAAAETTVEKHSEPSTTGASSVAPEPASARFCEHCGAERSSGGRFCTSCGRA